MLLRRRMVVVLWCLLLAAAAEEAPPGLVSKDSEHDLIAEASHSGTQTQKRETGLSNSYGEPLPPDAYGPPREIPNLIPDHQPAPIYGVPLQNNLLQETPPGAYGPPAPVVFPSQSYEGPPPPISKPKPLYGPPKFGPIKYGPPKAYAPQKFYGPPKKLYGPPKQSLPRPSYGAPFKSPKILKPFGPKPVYGPPKLKPVYGPPILNTHIPLDVPPLPAPTVTTIESSVTNFGNVGASIGTNFHGDFGSNFGSDLDLGLNVPAPIYGTPLLTDLKLPAETYGPPIGSVGPIGPNDQLLVQDLSNIGHYGPPQPDPDPRPPHPGIPAPPTPPHVLYDGWKPIPGASHQVGHSEEVIFQNIGVGDNYGPPPPPPLQEYHINLDQGISNVNLDQHLSNQISFDQHLPNVNQLQSFSNGQIEHLSNVNQLQTFSNAQIATGYSNVHQDALSQVDLNAIVGGGDSNHIDQSKTVFEAHYTENHNPQADLAFVQSAITIDKPSESYGAPLDSISYHGSVRQHGAKGLIPPSGVYGVPPGSHYGAPPKPPHANLPLPYGSYSGGAGHSSHTGGKTPKHPVKFRESVPEGLLENIGKTTHGKDTHGIDHLNQGPAYLPPPIRDAKDVNHHTSLGINLSIEPSSLYSLPHSGNPVNFQPSPPNSLYGSPIDSYSVPLLTVGDHTASGSTNNAVTTTIDGHILANLSNLDAAAILKHCPYHEAILKAAKYGEKIPVDLANKYMASLNSLGNTLTKNQNIQTYSSYNDQSTSQSVQTITKDQKAKSLRDTSFKSDNLKHVSEQILKTSEKIRNLSEETKSLQQKLASNNQNFNHINHSPVKTSQSYSVQIESSNGKGKANPTIPHDQLLSEGLLQSILQAIEQPGQSPVQTVHKQIQEPGFEDGLVLPAGYEPIDRTKQDLATQSSEVHKTVKDCDLNVEASEKHEVVVAPPKDKTDDNEVAIFFDREKEPVTEISVSTSISEKLEFGKKI